MWPWLTDIYVHSNRALVLKSLQDSDSDSDSDTLSLSLPLSLCLRLDSMSCNDVLHPDVLVQPLWRVSIWIGAGWPDLRPGDGCSPDCKVEALYESNTYIDLHILGAWHGVTLFLDWVVSCCTHKIGIARHSCIFSQDFFCWGVPTAVSFCVRFAKFDVEPWTQSGIFGIFGFSDLRISCVPNWNWFGCPPLPYQGWSKTSIRGLWWRQQLGSGQRKSAWKPGQQLPVLLVLQVLLV